MFIKQKLEVLEVVTGCETPNLYKVYAADANGERVGKQKPIFKCKEKSECCQRICCPGNCRAFKMKVKNYQKKMGDDDKNLFMIFSRPFKCTCFCLNRPHMDVMVSDAAQEHQEVKPSHYIGRLVNECMCCDVGVDIFGQDN